MNDLKRKENWEFEKMRFKKRKKERIILMTKDDGWVNQVGSHSAAQFV